MVLELELRRSIVIFWKRTARRDLLGEETRMGNSVVRRLTESMTSLLRRSTRLPTIFSRRSGCRMTWCCVRMALRSSGKLFVSSM